MIACFGHMGAKNRGPIIAIIYFRAHFIRETHTMTISDIELYGRTLPLHPSMKRERCPVCNLPHARAAGAPVVCALCLEKKGEAREIIESHLARISAEQRALDEKWAAFLGELDEETADRWTLLDTARARARGKVERALRGRYRERVSGPEIQALIDAARSEYDAVLAKVERTRRAEGNPLAPVLQEEARYRGAIETLQAERMRCDLALADLEDGLPF